MATFFEEFGDRFVETFTTIETESWLIIASSFLMSRTLCLVTDVMYKNAKWYSQLPPLEKIGKNLYLFLGTNFILLRMANEARTEGKRLLLTIG